MQMKNNHKSSSQHLCMLHVTNCRQWKLYWHHFWQYFTDEFRM